MSILDAMRFTLEAEKGYTVDQGGPTMNGVTQKVYDSYRRKEGLHLQAVRLIDPEEETAIMEDEYWYPAHCNEMSEKLGIAMFDWAFNHGVHGAIHTLQTCLGVTSDGVFGPGTQTALERQDDSEFLQKFLDARRAWYKRDIQIRPDDADDLKGWLNRVDNLENFLATMS